MLYQSLEIAPLFGLFLRLLLAQKVQGLDCALESGVGYMDVDFGRCDALMTQGLLGKPEVAGLLIEAGGEYVAERVDGAPVGDASLFEPVGEAKLYLTCSDAPTPVGKEERIIRLEVAADEMGLQQSPYASVQENELLCAVLPLDSERPLSEVNVLDIQSYERAQPDAGGQEESEHQMIPSCDRGLGCFERAEQFPNLSISEDGRRLSCSPGVPNQACRIVFEIASLGEELEKGPECRLHSVRGDRCSRLALFCVREGSRGEVTGEKLRSDLADIDASATPPVEGLEIAKIDGPGVRALSISPKLRIKPAYGSREPHLDHDPMNASPLGEVNSILRRSGTPSALGSSRGNPAECWSLRPPHLATVARFWEDVG